MKKYFLLIILCLVSSGLVMLAKPQVTLGYDPLATQCAKAPDSPACVNRDKQGNPVVKIIADATNLLAVLTGIAAVVMILVSGFTFITSGGSTDQIANARKRLVYAVIGLAVAALAWTIARFITDRLL